MKEKKAGTKTANYGDEEKQCENHEKSRGKWSYLRGVFGVKKWSNGLHDAGICGIEVRSGSGGDVF